MEVWFPFFDRMKGRDRILYLFTHAASQRTFTFAADDLVEARLRRDRGLKRMMEWDSRLRERRGLSGGRR